MTSILDAPEFNEDYKDETKRGDVVPPKPKIALIGAGGVGCNWMAIADKHIRPSLDLKKFILDTSRSNYHKVGSVKDIEFRLLTTKGEGLGKERSPEMVKLIEPKVQEFLLENENFDVYVVMFSLAGGTGSSTVQILVNELVNMNKAVVLFAVADSGSAVDCRNSISTLKSIENQASNGLVNIVPFDNTFSRSVVDMEFEEKINTFFQCMDIEGTSELDKKDIKMLLNPSNHRLVTHTGLKFMLINEGKKLAKSSYDSLEILHGISKLQINMIIDVMSTIQFTDQNKKLKGGMYILTGLELPEKLINNLEDTEEKLSRLKNKTNQWKRANDSDDKGFVY